MGYDRGMRYGWLACVVALAIACTTEDPAGVDGGTEAGADAGIGGPDAASVAIDAAPGCAAVPAPSQPWIRTYQDGIVAGLTASERSTGSNRPAPRAVITGWLQDLGYTVQTQNYGGGTNVYAQLDADVPGAQTIVVGAHFDTVPGSPGANDNATGVAMVLSLARYLRDVECRNNNVVFALFDEEEVGLVGSFHFAEMLATANVDVAAVHTIDQNGWDANGDRLIELERPSTGLFAQYQSANVFDIPLQQTQTGATDHVRFREFGFRAIGITEGFVSGDTTPHYHQASDTYATVDFAYLESTTILAHATLAAQVRAAGLAPRYAPPSVLPAFAPVHGCRSEH